jgi:TatA/E family protein of Tat protein translocase
MPFNIGPGELILILVIALVVLGPGKLPDVAQSLGKSIREFRKAATDVTDAGKLDVPATTPAPTASAATPAALPDAPPPAPPAPPAPTVSTTDAAPGAAAPGTAPANDPSRS